MNVDWLIPCRYVEIHDNLGSIMGAGIDTFWVPDLPGTIAVAFAIRLTGLPEELDSEIEHTSRNVVRAPNGQTIQDVTATFTVGGGPPGLRQDWLQGIMLGTHLTFSAETEGTYTFEHIVDSSSRSAPLHVVHGPPGPH